MIKYFKDRKKGKNVEEKLSHFMESWSNIPEKLPKDVKLIDCFDLSIWSDGRSDGMYSYHGISNNGVSRHIPRNLGFELDREFCQKGRNWKVVTGEALEGLLPAICAINQTKLYCDYVSKRDIFEYASGEYRLSADAMPSKDKIRNMLFSSRKKLGQIYESVGKTEIADYLTSKDLIYMSREKPCVKYCFKVFDADYVGSDKLSKVLRNLNGIAYVEEKISSLKLEIEEEYSSSEFIDKKLWFSKEESGKADEFHLNNISKLESAVETLKQKVDFRTFKSVALYADFKGAFGVYKKHGIRGLNREQYALMDQACRILRT